MEYQQVVELINQSLGVMSQSISQLNHDYTSLAADVGVIKTDLDWIMRFFWLMMGAAVTNFVASLFYIITQYGKRKNGNNKE